MKCIHCGKEITDDSVFCPFCGQKTEQINQGETEESRQIQNTEEPADAEETESSEKTELGENGESNGKSEPKTEEIAESQTLQEQHIDDTPNEVKKDAPEESKDEKEQDENDSKGILSFFTNNKKTVGIAAFAVVAVILIIALISARAGGSKRQIFYLKDNEIVKVAGSKFEKNTIADNVLRNDDDVDYYRTPYWYISFSDDKKYVFYPQRYDRSDDGFTLYYCDVEKGSKEEVRIDTDVQQYVLLSGNTLLYTKFSDGTRLYYYDGTESNKIASNVSSFWISDDKKNVLWEEDNGDESKIYVNDVKGKNDKFKIGTCDYFYGRSDDFAYIIYQKDDSLYVCKDMKESEKIASNVADVDVHSWDNLEVYYSKKGDVNEISFYDVFVDDDLYASDANITEPDIKDYTTTETVDSFWGTREREVVDDKYYEALNQYEKKQERDILREELKEYNIQSLKRIYCYDGRDSVEIASFDKDSIVDWMYLNAYMVVNTDEIEKITMSRIVSIISNSYDYDELFKEIFDGIEGTVYVFENMTSKKIAKGIGKIAGGFYYDENEDGVFYLYLADIDDIIFEESSNKYYIYFDGEDISDLYVSENGEAKLLAEDVYWVEALNERVYYLTDYENGAGELYSSLGKISDDVHIAFDAISDNNIAYITDIDSKGESGTLYIYDDRESTRIDDDVNIWSYIEPYEGAVAYLKDYNFKYNYGDLYLYTKGATKRIDTDVTGLLKTE